MSEFLKRYWLLLVKEFKTFPSKTCLKHFMYANKNMGLYAQIYIPTPSSHWPLLPLGLENIRPIYSESQGCWATNMGE